MMTPELIFIIYCSVIVLSYTVFIFLAGMGIANVDDADMAFFAAMLWPALLPSLVFVGLMYLVYRLGKLVRK